jgi:hypothetical protein
VDEFDRLENLIFIKKKWIENLENVKKELTFDIY